MPAGGVGAAPVDHLEPFQNHTSRAPVPDVGSYEVPTKTQDEAAAHDTAPGDTLLLLGTLGVDMVDHEEPFQVQMNGLPGPEFV